jgi:hypothetical protein
VNVERASQPNARFIVERRNRTVRNVHTASYNNAEARLAMRKFESLQVGQ